jgi:hypothetical protein
MLRRACLVIFFVVFLPATVQAFDHHHHHDDGGDKGGGCGASHASSHTEPEGPSGGAAGATTHKRVFVTPAMYSGALGSLAAADAFCASSAAAHELSGRYVGWISDATTNAYDRISEVGPWYTTGGKLAFASKAALLDAPEADLFDEWAVAASGGAAPAVVVWSGTDAAGVATTENCDGWANATASATATTGSALGNDHAWGGGGPPLRCDGKAALICFEQ